MAKASGNETLALSLPLNSQTNIDWALTILFYSAVHYIEAYLSTRNQHLRSHTTRDSYIGRDSKLKKIFEQYQDLKYYGYIARYEAFGFKTADVTEVAAKSLASIRAHIEGLIQ